jgi:hypothetical protein
VSLVSTVSLQAEGTLQELGWRSCAGGRSLLALVHVFLLLTFYVPRQVLVES